MRENRVKEDEEELRLGQNRTVSDLLNIADFCQCTLMILG